MLKNDFDVTITITIIFTIILYPVLPTLAYGHQFAFANQTTTIIIKNQISNIQNKSMTFYRGEGNNNSISANIDSTNHNLVILNFYDDVKSQFTNAKPILDKYGFKGTFFIVCNWAGSVPAPLRLGPGDIGTFSQPISSNDLQGTKYHFSCTAQPISK